MLSLIAVALVVQTVALTSEVSSSDGPYEDFTSSTEVPKTTLISFGDIVKNASVVEAKPLLKKIQTPAFLSLSKTITIEDVFTEALTTAGYNTKDTSTSAVVLSETKDNSTKEVETTKSSSPESSDWSTSPSTPHIPSITSPTDSNGTNSVVLDKTSTQVPKSHYEFTSRQHQDMNPTFYFRNFSSPETHVSHESSTNESSTTTATSEATRIPKRIQGIRDRPARPDPGYSHREEVERPYRPDTPLHEYSYFRPTPEDRTSIIRQDPQRFYTPYRPSYPYVAQGSFGRPYRPESLRPESNRPDSNRPSTSPDEISRADEYTRLAESLLKDQRPSAKPFSIGTVISTKNITRVEYLKADCFDNYMKVTIRFNGSFDGLIYSTGYAQDLSCNYVNGSGQYNYEFMIRLNRCGTLGQQDDNNGYRKRKERSQYLVNTVTVQYNAVIEEDIDEHFRVTCEYGYDFWKTVTFPVLNVESASLQQLRTGSPVVFTLPPPQCTMELRNGFGPNAPRITGPVNVGDPITLIIRMKSDSTGFDILVSNCFAHNGAQKRLQLIDSHGCVVEDKLMTEFHGEDTAQEITLSSHLKAFRFTGSPALYLECDVHMCHGSCPFQLHFTFLMSVGLVLLFKAFRFTGSPALYLECDAHMCHGSCSAQRCYWRIKRSAGEEEEEEGVLSESVSLFQALEVRHLDEPQTKSNDDMICIGSGGFAALSSCVLLFLLVSTCASFCMCVRKNKLNKKHFVEFDGQIQLK